MFGDHGLCASLRAEECAKSKVAVELDACRRAALQNENAENAELPVARVIGGITSLRKCPKPSRILARLTLYSSIWILASQRSSCFSGIRDLYCERALLCLVIRHIYFCLNNTKTCNLDNGSIFSVAYRKPWESHQIASRS